MPSIPYEFTQIGDDIAGDLDAKYNSGKSVAISEDGQRVASAGNIAFFKAYDFDSGTGLYAAVGDMKALMDARSMFAIKVVMSPDGAYLLVGQPAGDNNEGKAQLLDGTQTDATWIATATVVGGTDEKVGTSVGMSTDASKFFIGSSGVAGQTVKQYTLDGSDFVLGATFENTDAVSFGDALAIDATGDTLLVGALDFDAGAAFVYLLNDPTTIVQTISGTDTGDKFGKDMSMSHDSSRIAIGSINAASVAVYDWDDSNNEYSIIGFFKDAVSTTQYGSKISLSGNGERLLVGAPKQTNGKAFLYVVNSDVNNGSDDYGLIEINEFEGSGAYRFGTDVALSTDGTYIAIGARVKYDSSGAILVYESNQ